MDDEAILALYEWRPGTCFRCGHADVDTAVVKRLRPRAGGVVEVQACSACVLALEVERRHDAERHDRDYTPGHVADGDA